MFFLVEDAYGCTNLVNGEAIVVSFVAPAKSPSRSAKGSWRSA